MTLNAPPPVDVKLAADSGLPSPQSIDPVKSAAVAEALPSVKEASVKLTSGVPSVAVGAEAVEASVNGASFTSTVPNTAALVLSAVSVIWMVKLNAPEVVGVNEPASAMEYSGTVPMPGTNCEPTKLRWVATEEPPSKETLAERPATGSL